MATVYRLEYWYTAVDAEKPAGATAGQILYCLDTQRTYRAESSTSWRLASDVGSSHINITRLEDFPTPVGDVITLVDNTAYRIVGTVNIGANRIVCGIKNAIVGTDRLNDVLTSTTTGALLTADSTTIAKLSLVVNSVTLQAASGAVFDFIQTGLSVAESSPKGATLGTFNACSTITFRQCGFISALTTGGATFTGAMGSLRFFDNVVSGNAGTLLTLGSTVFDNVFIHRNRVTVSGEQTFLSGTTGGGNVTVAGVLSNNIFSGAGTYVATLTNADTNWIWAGNAGVEDQTDLQDALELAQANLDDLERRFRLLFKQWVVMGFPIPGGLETETAHALEQE